MAGGIGIDLRAARAVARDLSPKILQHRPFPGFGLLLHQQPGTGNVDVISACTGRNCRSRAGAVAWSGPRAIDETVI